MTNREKLQKSIDKHQLDILRGKRFYCLISRGYWRGITQRAELVELKHNIGLIMPESSTLEDRQVREDLLYLVYNQTI